MDDTLKKVLIVDGAIGAINLKARAVGISTLAAGIPIPEPVDWRTRQHSDDGPRDHTVYVGDADARGKIAPVKTNMAAKFPLMSRRERRERQREEKRAAKAGRGSK